MAEKLNVNEQTIHRDMEELKKLIEHIGPTKGGYWKIKDHKKNNLKMAKEKTLYVCTHCGQDSPKWMGKCPPCGQWNTYV